MSELHPLFQTLVARSGGACELCEAADAREVHAVAGGDATRPEHAALLCAGCAAALASQDADAHRWACLQRTAWSEVPAVQVLAWRQLHALADAPWASDLRDQLYLDDETLAWAQAGLPSEGAGHVDSNGAPLADGDAVTLIKDLEVKGGGFTAKRGTLVKGIRLTDDPGLVEGRVNGVAIVLKTAFLKRAR